MSRSLTFHIINHSHETAENPTIPRWDARYGTAFGPPSGIYPYRLETVGKTLQCKLTLIK